MDKSSQYDVIVIGGGASGFFAAIACKQKNPSLKVGLLEGSGRVLTKVRISGGGRCNVCHSCFDNSLLVQKYPRGSKELRQVFSRFNSQSTVDWFKNKGIELKTESDGRMFSITNKSETIVNCLTEQAEKSGLHLLKKHIVNAIEKKDDRFIINLRGKDSLKSKKLLIATGGAPAGYDLASSLGHSIVPIVPSLFTFKINLDSLTSLAGLSVKNINVSLSFENSKKKFKQDGPILITHWGLSGPSILKLSAWGAREIYENNYKGQLNINWLPHLSKNDVSTWIQKQKIENKKKSLYTTTLAPLPKRLWAMLLEQAQIPNSLSWIDCSQESQRKIVDVLHNSIFKIDGKGEYKDEFVNCGGVNLKEINFKNMESKVCKNLYFSGEILNIDGVTGGFNFQNAWSTGWIAGTHMAENEN